MVRLGRERTVERDDVGGLDRRQEVDVRDAEVHQVLVAVRVDGEDVAPEVPQQAGDDRTDLAGADHCGGLARHVEPDQPVEREVAVAHAVVGAMDVPVERQDHGQRVLGDGVGRVGGYPHDRHADPAGVVDVDVVEAGTPHRDDPDAPRLERVEHDGADVVVDERAHRVGARGERGGRRCEADVVVVDVEDGFGTECGVERGPVVRLGGVDDEAGVRHVEQSVPPRPRGVGHPDP